MTGTVSLHPLIDNGVPQGSQDFNGGILVCECTDRPVKVRVDGDVAHNHACGCTKCWKPAGATFSIVAVVAHDKITVLENGDKLEVVDKSALIQRHACKGCGVHMYGPVVREHPFQGLDFIHPERFDTDGWAPPGFAAFVSSIIEAGTDPADMDAIRQRLSALGLPPFDCLSPGLMDYIATWTAKKSGVLKS
ncbi:S-(hydroxymethyl)glutathione synthase [Rhizobium herbae]|uniref:Glutathione-dependent formaldehyde-activating enzyme n=1 Tax=Rhizobium herbae TaxID=508661 RepID=A0ABS7HEC3_9HYPH|nr:S-(hydroxymethyl)glutathione synthase [Rhizobium herbae]MBW9065543.1 S-(hydroxymethyl)glutathione synthase [Rhizobium herbae]